MTNRRRKVHLPTGRLPIFAEAAPAIADLVRGVDAINRAFEAFKAENNAAIAEIAKKGTNDVVQAEKIDRINAEMSRREAEITDLQRQIAALRVGGPASPGGLTTEARAHADAFGAYARRGVGAGELGALAVRAALTTEQNPDGGYVVPREMDQTITRVLTTVSALRRLAGVRTVGTQTLTELHSLGGATSGWVGETEARPETATPTVLPLEYTAMEIYAEPRATQTMLDDAFLNVEAWIAGEVAIQFAEQESVAFITGNGIKKPRGILSYPFVANTSYTVNSAANWAKVGYVPAGAAGAFVTPTATASGYDRLVDLYHALRAGYRANARWLMSDATLATVRKLRQTTVGEYAYMPPTETEPGTILGKPVETDDNMPAIAADSHSIAFADFAQAYRIIDRMGVRVLRDEYTAKPYIKFYTTKRVGGGMRNFEAIKTMRFATS